jgi:hypothetical protein
VVLVTYDLVLLSRVVTPNVMGDRAGDERTASRVLGIGAYVVIGGAHVVRGDAHDE